MLSSVLAANTSITKISDVNTAEKVSSFVFIVPPIPITYSYNFLIHSMSLKTYICSSTAIINLTIFIENI